MKNISLPGVPHRILQVGLVVDRNFLEWEIVDQRIIGYISAIVISLFLASVFLTLFLLAPLRLLIGHLNEATSHLGNLKDVNPLPSGLTRFTKGFWTRSDEFSSLVSTVNKLIARINMNYKLTRSWTLQMAHELKTPLAIIRARTESKKMANLIPAQYAEDVTSEIHGMSEVISQFLDWAELENSQGQRDIHSLRLTSVIQSVASRLEEVSPSRIHVKTCSDVSIFANPIHLDQLITNLVSNALKFSPFSKPVEIVLSNRTLSIRDYGSGLPQEVRERLGQPFNVGTNDENGFTGNGLGLAWVSTVAKLYNWEFEIRADSSGTEAIVQFPLEGI